MRQLDRYTCEEAFRRLDDYLDRELSPGDMARMQEHLETCAGCAREFAFEASVLDGVKRKLRRIDIPGDVLARLTLAIAQQRHGSNVARGG